MVRDGILDDLEKFLLGVDGADGESVKELDHQTRKTLEGTRDSDGGADFDEDAFGGVDVDLKAAGLVDWRIEEGKEAL